VPQRVAERLAGDRVRRHLDRGVERAERLDARRAPGHLVADHQLAQRPLEPALVEHRRSQAVHERAQVGDRLAQAVTQAERASGERGLVAALEPAGEGLELERGAGQRGRDAVVQVRPEPAALLLAGDHDPLPAPCDVGHQVGRVGEGPRPVGHLVDRGPLLGSPPLARRPQPDVQLAHRLPERGHGDRTAAVDRLPRGHRDVLTGERGVREPERVAEAVDQPLQCVDRLRCRGDPAADVGDDGVRVVPVAEERPVDHRLHPVPSRRGEERGHGHEHDAPARAGRDRVGEVDHADVHQHDEAGEHAEDDGAVEGQLHVEEPVAEHRDPDARGETHETDRKAHLAERQYAGDQHEAAEEQPLQLGALDVVGASPPRQQGEHRQRGPDDEQQERPAHGHVPGPGQPLELDGVHDVRSEVRLHRRHHAGDGRRRGDGDGADQHLSPPGRDRATVREEVGEHRHREEVGDEAPDGEPGGRRAEHPLAIGVGGVDAGEEVGADHRRDQHQPAHRVARLCAHDEGARDRPGDAQGVLAGIGRRGARHPHPLEEDQGGHAAQHRCRRDPGREEDAASVGDSGRGHGGHAAPDHVPE